MEAYKYFRNKRMALGLTQAEVATKAGVSNACVSKFENPNESEKLSELYKNSIKSALNSLMHGMEREEFIKVKLVENVLNAVEDDISENERRRLLISAINNASKLLLDDPKALPTNRNYI